MFTATKVPMNIVKAIYSFYLPFVSRSQTLDILSWFKYIACVLVYKIID